MNRTFIVTIAGDDDMAEDGLMAHDLATALRRYGIEERIIVAEVDRCECNRPTIATAVANI